MSREQVAEVITHLAFWPNAMTAANVPKGVFAKREDKPTLHRISDCD